MRNPMIVLYVADMATALAFYRDALEAQVLTSSAGWSLLSCAGLLIGLHGVYGSVEERPVPYAGLNLEVDDLDPAIARMVSYGAKLVEIREAEPRVPVRLGVLLAPCGNGLELRQQMG
jgi:catechol 2,3-dioxygenase-like lactoylglutathione lyase family enzyme